MSGASKAGPIKIALMRKVVPAFGLLLIRALDLTWRYRETGRENFDALLMSGRPLVGAFLHGRTVVLLRFMSRPRNGRWISMCSKSLDGDALTKIERRLGFEVVRGSSGRDGLQAAADMIRRVRAESNIKPCLAVDGSRGPRGRVQGGIISVAQRTGGVIQPITASARPAHIFKRSWDRTLLPWPFARVEVVYGRPLEVPAKLSASEVRELATKLEERFARIQSEADRRSGFSDPEPLCAPTVDSPPESAC